MSTSKKERFMRNIKLSLVITAAFAVTLVVGTPAQATDKTWLPTAAGTYLWADANNWDPNLGLPPTDDGGRVANITPGGSAAIIIDLDGNAVNLAASRVELRYGNITIDDLTQVDPALKARLTANDIYTNNASGTHTYNVPITASIFRTRLNPNQLVTLNAPFTITTIDKGWPGSQGRETLNINASPEVPITTFLHNNWITNFNAPGEITTLNFITGHSTNSFNANAELTIGTLNMTYSSGRNDVQTFNANAKVNIGTFNMQYGIYSANDPNGMPLGTYSIPAGTTMKVTAAQNAWPTLLTVSGGAALFGDITGAVFSGGGKNTDVTDDTVLGVTAGTPPTRAELGGAILLQGLGDLTSGPYLVGDDGDPNTIFKGFAIGGWTAGTSINTEISAKPGTGDLYGFIAAANIVNTAGAIYQADSKTATFKFSPGGYLNLSASFNQNVVDDANYPNKITTFNLVRDPGGENATILNFGNAAGKILDGQTVHAEGGKVITVQNLTGGGLLGALEVKNAILALPTDDFSAADTGTLSFSGRTAIELPNGDAMTARALVFEALEDRLTYSDHPTMLFSDRNGGPWIYDFDLAPGGSSPWLALFLADVDYGSNHYHPVDIGSQGLLIGDGKFLNSDGTTNSTGAYVGQDTGGGVGKILPGQAGPITMGFAAMSKNLSIQMDVVAPNATLQIGTTDPDRLLKTSSGNFETAIPTNRVTFAQAVSAAAVNVRSGSVQFAQDLTIAKIDIGAGTQLIMAGGKLATVTDTLSGTGKWSGGLGVAVAGGATVAPGASIGVLNDGGGDLIMADGAIYEWEIADATGVAGTGWDLIAGTNITFEGDLTFKVLDAGLAGDLDGSESFIVADVTGTIDDTLLGTITFDLPGWSGGSLAIVEDTLDGGYDLVLSGLLTSLIGDADDNGVVNAADYIALKTNIGLGSGATTADGDFDGDGDVDFDDLQLLQGNYGAGSSATGSIPEPATLGLLAVGAMALLRRNRRS